MLAVVGWLTVLTAAAAPHPDVAGAHLNASTFFSTLHAPDAGRYILLFFSPHCGHCAAMLPAWAELERRVQGMAQLAAVNAEAEKMIADRLDVNGFPTLMAVESGRLYEYEGGRSADELLLFASAPDLATVAGKSRRLPHAPSRWDPLLRVPDALVEIVLTSWETSALAAALIAAALVCFGVCIERGLRPLEAPFITVECPEGVQPGQSFTVEFVSGLSRLRPRGRKRRMDVVAPAGIAAGQTFFVPLVSTPRAQAPPRPDPKAKAKGE